MTALKPSESLRVRGVPATKYPTNQTCAHPNCMEPAGGVHHCYPRSLIGNDSYFVVVLDEDGNECSPFPHAVGLCGSGTTGHHGDVEEHRAWIRLEDGEFVWYDRQKTPREATGAPLTPSEDEWVRLGGLNPQPGSREGKPKRKRTVKGTEERAARKTVSVRLPEGVSGDDWDELLSEAEGIELQQPDTPFDPARGGVAIGKLLVTVLERFTGRLG